MPPRPRLPSNRWRGASHLPSSRSGSSAAACWPSQCSPDPARSRWLASPAAIWGFAKNLAQAPLFYALVAVGTVGGTALSLVHVNPIKLLVVSAVINGLAAGPFLVIVMLISDDREIMGEHRNGRSARSIGWATTALMAIAGLALIYTTVSGA